MVIYCIENHKDNNGIFRDIQCNARVCRYSAPIFFSHRNEMVRDVRDKCLANISLLCETGIFTNIRNEKIFMRNNKDSIITFCS